MRDRKITLRSTRTTRFCIIINKYFILTSMAIEIRTCWLDVEYLQIWWSGCWYSLFELSLILRKRYVSIFFFLFAYHIYVDSSVHSLLRWQVPQATYRHQDNITIRIITHTHTQREREREKESHKQMFWENGWLDIEQLINSSKGTYL